MYLAKEVICSQCGRKQVTDVDELWGENLFWRTCEFCQRYGLYRSVRQKLHSVRDWLTAIYQCMNFSPVEKSFFPPKDAEPLRRHLAHHPGRQPGGQLRQEVKNGDHD